MVKLYEESQKDEDNELALLELQDAQDDIIELMHQRFLDGLDEEYFDYATVDLSEKYDDIKIYRKDIRENVEGYFDDKPKHMQKAETIKFVEAHWDSWFVQGLGDFVRIPNLTPMVDPNYLTNQLLE